jgi:hypothetical protein
VRCSRVSFYQCPGCFESGFLFSLLSVVECYTNTLKDIVIQLICLRVPTKTEVTYSAHGHGQRSKTTAFIRRELVRTDGHTKVKTYWIGIIPQCICEKSDSRPRWEWHLVKTTLMFHKFERDSESPGVLKVVSDTEGSPRRERDVNAVVVGEEFHGDGGDGGKGRKRIVGRCCGGALFQAGIHGSRNLVRLCVAGKGRRLI